jgi:two-component system sensor histidine kinase DesK
VELRLGRFFEIDPDSLVGRRVFGPGANPRMRWVPLFSLVWTFWLFASPLFDPRAFAHWLLPTMSSFVVFLFFYVSAYYRPLRWVTLNALCIAALGYGLMWYNPGATCYEIYACAFLAFGPSPPRSLALMLLLLVPYASILYQEGTPWPFALSTLVMGLAVGISNMAFRSSQIKDAQLQLSHDEIRRLAATAERERIGRDLHDLLGHTLSLIALKSELAGKLLARDPVAARREIGDVERITRDALAQVRSAVTGMRAAGLIGEIASARLLLECAGVRFTYRGFERDLPPAQESCLALALREAVTNIQRHARAASAEAELTSEPDAIVLRVRDDGHGGIHDHGNGLTGMRERVEAEGGTLKIASVRGEGTTLLLRLPVAKAANNVIDLAGAATRKAQA